MTTILKTILNEIETAAPRDHAEVLARTLADEEEIDYRLPPLTSGARVYLARFDGDRPRLALESWKVAAEYGSLETHRLHAVKAAQRLGIYKGNGNGQ